MLGLLPSIRFTGAQTDLHSGNVLVLYTESIVEAAEADARMYDVEGLLESGKAVHPDYIPATMGDCIMSDVGKLCVGMHQGGDQRLIVISRAS